MGRNDKPGEKGEAGNGGSGRNPVLSQFLCFLGAGRGSQKKKKKKEESSKKFHSRPGFGMDGSRGRVNESGLGETFSNRKRKLTRGKTKGSRKRVLG